MSPSLTKWPLWMATVLCWIGMLALPLLAGNRVPQRQSLLAATLPQAPTTPASPAALSPAPKPSVVLAKAVSSPPTRLVAPAKKAFPQRYSVINLGCVGTASFASGINNTGRVVGSCQTPHGDVAFLWQGGKLISLGSFSATAINDRGQITGFRLAADGTEHPLFGTGFHMQPIAPAGAAYAYRVNNQGQVIANALRGPKMTSLALLWSGNRLWKLAAPGFEDTQANAINDLGEVAGSASDAGGHEHACAWLHGHLTLLGQLPGGAASAAQGINNRGKIVGWSFVNGSITHAFAYRPGRLADLGTLAGWPKSAAVAINDSGQIVGNVEKPSGSGTVSHAVVWQGGRIADLNTLIPKGSGWIITEVADINNRGQIVGDGLYWGKRRAFLLTPLAAKPISTQWALRQPAAKPPAWARPRPVVEKVAAYRQVYRRPLPGVAWRHASRTKPAPAAPAQPATFQGRVVGTAAWPASYVVRSGKTSRVVRLRQGASLRVGQSVRIRGMVHANGVVGVWSASPLATNHAVAHAARRLPAKNTQGPVLAGP